MSIDQQIYNLAIQEGFSPTASKLIVAQARYESTDYTSNVFNNNNNMYGMKYVGQTLAEKGTLAPDKELSSSCKNGGQCLNSDYYAKYKSPSDSAKDVIQRLYKKTRNGIGFEELKDVKDAQEFANKLKTRNYFGFYDINTPEGQEEANKYAKNLNYKLLKIQVLDFVRSHSTPIKYGFVGIIILSLTAVSYWMYKNYK